MTAHPGFGILGPLQVHGSDGEVPLRGAKLRTLVALLCLDSGRTVSTDLLREVLWSGDPPPTADNAVQVYVASARKLLGQMDAAGAALETMPHGYRLVLPDGMLDRDEFLSARADAAQAAARGLPESAAAHYRAALAVWRGPALGELADLEGLTLRAQELNRLELDTFEAFAENELALARHRDLVVALERRARQNPLRESLWALLALALYRADQQSEALSALRIVRTALDDQLGVEPGDRLRTLEIAILRRDPALASASPSGAGAAGPGPAPLGAGRTVTDVRSDLAVVPLVLELADGTTVTTTKPAVVVGRDASCDILIGEASVSARHARITTTVHGHVIEDLLSTNGTYVNGESVTRRVLIPGDLIELGRIPVHYGRAAAAPTAPRPG